MGNKTKIAVKALVIVFLVLAVRFILGGPEDSWICQNNAWVKHGNPSAPMPETQCGNKTANQEKTDLIKISEPKSGDKIKSPVSVSGEARGNWYFEASFPVQVLDEDGTVLGSSSVQAKGGWMTEDFVPFTGEIDFSKPKGKTGTIIFKKDNPSGLPANDDSVSIPVGFQ
jgi:hypothetical protein